MAGMGPPPKPSYLRQRTNKKSGATTLTAAASAKTPEIPNPDGRVWHPLTVNAWKRAWRSEMAGQWLETDADGLGRLAIVWDNFYKEPEAKNLAEIRLQEQRFGLSPLDRSRLQWEISRADEAGRKRKPADNKRQKGSADPRAFLTAIK